MWNRAPERTLFLVPGGIGAALHFMPLHERLFRHINVADGLLTSYANYYNTILLSASRDQSNVCENVAPPNFSVEQIMKCIEAECGDNRVLLQLGIVHYIYSACIAAELRTCSSATCVSMKDSLVPLMPRCPSWLGIECWALQFAACLCSQKTDPNVSAEKQECLPQMATVVSDIIRKYRGDHPHKEVLYEEELPQQWVCIASEYIEWATGVDLGEIMLLFSWLRALATGEYEPIPQQMEIHSTSSLSNLGAYNGGPLTIQVKDAIQRAHALDLCPHRVWAVASNLPGRELNLPALVPGINHPAFPVTGHGIRHRFCTFDFCQESTINFTSVEQLHQCNDKEKETCSLTHEKMFSDDTQLQTAAKMGQPTAWSLDGYSVLSPDKPFMAISHIWADGAGVGTWKAGRVNQCLYTLFCDIAHSMKCDGLWWDTICIPTEKTARVMAINNMHINYSQANCTLVHDLYLRNTPWVDAESACFAIVMSTWFTRSWTALELAKRVKVVPILRNMNLRILMKIFWQNVVNLAHHVTRLQLQQFMPCVTK
jgi:hypothetical protein